MSAITCNGPALKQPLERWAALNMVRVLRWFEPCEPSFIADQIGVEVDRVLAEASTMTSLETLEDGRIRIREGC